jgi:uncharacterized membrane protein
MSVRCAILLASIGLLGAAVAGPAAAQQGERQPKDPPVSFKKQVYPVLYSRCEPCHYPKDKKGGLDVSTWSALLKGGKTKPGIVPGAPEKSVFVKEISGKDPSMPKNANPLKPEEVELISAWIRQGARNN